MDFAPSARAADLTARVRDFMAREVEPAEPQYHRDLADLRAHGDPWQPLPLLADLQAKARAEGLWNLFLPEGARRGVRRAASAPTAARG